MASSTGGQDEAVLSSNNVPVAKFSSYISSVCYLVLQSNGNDKKASGFLAKFQIDNRKKIVVVMNNHFIETKEDANNVIVTFKFDGKSEFKIVKLEPEIYFRTNKELDYTFVGINQQHVKELRERHGITPVRLEQFRLAVNTGDMVHIPQHPQGRSQRLSWSPVCSIARSEVYYKADTSFGSSGSPVLYSQNNDMFVLALHKAGGVMLPDGSLANKGILISAILAHICQSSADNDNRPSNNEGTDSLSSNGNKESGEYVQDSTINQGLPVVQSPPVEVTNQGFPIVHPQSAENVPLNSNSDFSPGLEPSCPTRNLIQETENPAKTSHSESPATVMKPCVQPFPNTPDCPRNSRRQAVCQDPFEPKELIRIAQRISGVWLTVAKLTNRFRSWELDNISCDASLHNPTLKADRMLTDFKARLGTREVLAEAISESGKPKVAANVRSGFYINNNTD